MIPRRSFLIQLSAATVGAATVGLSLASAWAQAFPYRLRQSTRAVVQRAGLSRRLSRAKVSNFDDAFKLANRKTEIEVTR